LIYPVINPQKRNLKDRSTDPLHGTLYLPAATNVLFQLRTYFVIAKHKVSRRSSKSYRAIITAKLPQPFGHHNDKLDCHATYVARNDELQPDCFVAISSQ